MKVLQVIPAMSASAGAETSLHAVAPFLLESGIDLHLAVLTPHQDLVDDLQRLGVVVHDLSSLGPVRRISGLASLVRQVRPDLVHASLLEAALPSQLVGLVMRVPVLVTWASTPTDRRELKHIPRWKLEVVHCAEWVAAAVSRNRFHAVTEGVAATKSERLHVSRRRVRVAERGRDPASYVALDTRARRALRNELGIDDEDHVFLSVGRHEPAKAYPDLLEAFDIVAQRHPRARLLVAGRRGSSSEQMDELRRRLRAGERVSFLGHHDDIPQLMAAADSVVCASYREGAAGALIEAMAVQTPIVSVELDGMSGVVEDGENAIVVPRDQLADAMGYMITDERSAVVRAQRARRLFEDRFTIHRSAEQLATVYRWAVDPGGRASIQSCGDG